MHPGPERAAGLDRDGPYAVGRRLPGRADPQRADDDAVMEIPPAFFPALGDLANRDGGEVRA
jgi:hypothetical protein